jgi:hypothetical protein
VALAPNKMPPNSSLTAPLRWRSNNDKVKEIATHYCAVDQATIETVKNKRGVYDHHHRTTIETCARKVKKKGSNVYRPDIL